MSDYYDQNADFYFNQTKDTDMSSIYQRFLPEVKKNGRILDLGAGSGRDAFQFQKKGWEVDALEASDALCMRMKKNFSGRVIHDRIEEYHPIKPYDAIWACASLLHLTKPEFLRFMRRLPELLKPGGILYASGKNGIETGYQPDGRYFLEFTKQLIEEAIRVNPQMRLLDLWYTSDLTGRKEVRWLNVMLRYAG